MEIYALYSETKKRYFRPIFARDLDEAKAQIVDLVISTNDQVIVNSLDDLTLYRLGIFIDDEEDETEPLKSEVAWPVCDDLVRELPFPPMVRSKILKLYEITPDWSKLDQKSDSNFSSEPVNKNDQSPKNPGNLWSRLIHPKEVKPDAET